MDEKTFENENRNIIENNQSLKQFLIEKCK